MIEKFHIGSLNMLKWYLTFVVLVNILFTESIYAQRYGQRVIVTVNAGYATTSQKSLKNYQQEMLSQMPVKGKITNSFPGYLNYSFDIVFFDSTYYAGFMMGHTSTGGRIQYNDYSGSITADQLVKMNYRGILIAKRIIPMKYGGIFLGTELLAYHNKVELKYDEIVLDQKYAYSEQLESLNIAAGFFAIAQKRVEAFFFKASVGYEFHFATELYVDDPENIFTTPSGNTLKVNAEGFRFNLGVGYTLYKRSPKKVKY